MAEMASLQDDNSEGKHVQLFRVRMRGVFEKIMTGVSLEKFEEIYEAVLQGRLSCAGRLHTIWTSTALEGMVKELDEVIIEENVNDKLKQLAEITEECQQDRGTLAWRPPANLSEHVRSFDMKEKIKRRNEFEAFVSDKEAEVEKLKREVSDGRMRVWKLENVLNEQLNKLRSVYERENKYQAELQVHFDQLKEQVQ
ncbi:uncharacterized protein LOC110838588 [Zootermopsis nevadensis]|uniref:Polyamine-modulated factor 1 n=1 Tax=Zootermopsis nevadensis TaxID=136037 RepID=A0A067QKZ1_ZOONE|nr:uncharacterized protein LOC110838588 [Zootermopsis nevadensis]KDR09640.1 hypothetical protein L798_00786 [Zootermopsis nevadensis]